MALYFTQSHYYKAPMTVSSPDQKTLLPPADASICIRNPRLDSDKNILHWMIKERSTRVISFWYNPSVSLDEIEKNPDAATGEISIGPPNKQRFLRSTTVRFPLSEDADAVVAERQTWIVRPISVTSFSDSYLTLFDLDHQYTYFPAEFYNEIVKNIKPELKHPLKQLPPEIRHRINEYIDTSVIDTTFPCESSYKLNPIRFGGLHIAASKLWDEDTNGICFLRIRPTGNDTISLGFHLIKQFHISFGFPLEGTPYVDVSEPVVSSGRCYKMFGCFIS